MLALIFLGGLLFVVVASCKPSRRFVHPCHKHKPTIYPVKVVGYTVQTTGSNVIYRSKG